MTDTVDSPFAGDLIRQLDDVTVLGLDELATTGVAGSDVQVLVADLGTAAGIARRLLELAEAPQRVVVAVTPASVAGGETDLGFERIDAVSGVALVTVCAPGQGQPAGPVLTALAVALGRTAAEPATPAAPRVDEPVAVVVKPAKKKSGAARTPRARVLRLLRDRRVVAGAGLVAVLVLAVFGWIAFDSPAGAVLALALGAIAGASVLLALLARRTLGRVLRAQEAYQVTLDKHRRSIATLTALTRDLARQVDRLERSTAVSAATLVELVVREDLEP
ncbi:hypothetical protein [Cellulomonas alba]|uniref:Uncharacterized protein n=1 Tax=Cellulomonas alba TaxID=3053467 RepID=A0ABT7SCX3_9CELL|nr:hypothetical protein [Cellulomonas alba]MDM7854033.1 hypothetical protein [Cellulomonas alba]